MSDASTRRALDLPEDPDRGHPSSDWGILKAIRKVRDVIAALMSALEGLNAVDPDFRRLEREKLRLDGAFRQLKMKLDRGVERSQDLAQKRASLSLERAFRHILDLEAGFSNPLFEERDVEHKLIKEKEFIKSAYNKLPILCSLKAHETIEFRKCWAFTAVMVLRAATLSCRIRETKMLLDHMVSGQIGSYDAYYFAQLLTKMAWQTDH